MLRQTTIHNWPHGQSITSTKYGNVESKTGCAYNESKHTPKISINYTKQNYILKVKKLVKSYFSNPTQCFNFFFYYDFG